MSVDVERIRREHVCRTRVQRLSTGHGYDICARCAQTWPCDAIQLVEDNVALRERAERLEIGLLWVGGQLEGYAAALADSGYDQFAREVRGIAKEAETAIAVPHRAAGEGD